MVIFKVLYIYEVGLKALAFLASHNIVHADVKANNFLVRLFKRTLVIADFGISQIADKNGVVKQEGDFRLYGPLAPPETQRSNSEPYMLVGVTDVHAFAQMICTLVVINSVEWIFFGTLFIFSFLRILSVLCI